ncbi:MAG: hypothetical protein PHE12_01990 [Clostridia bacterium]|nr:hypothetical protein [Clostridia bacterium]
MATKKQKFADTLYAVKVGLLFVGTIVGAGFASGKEILTFFSGSPLTLIAAVTVAGIFFYSSCMLFFRLGKRLKCDDLFCINKILLRRYSKIFNIFLALCYLTLIAAMLAATDALAAESAGYKGAFPIFSVLILILGIALTRKGITGILKINSLLVPLIVFFIFAVCFYWLSPQQIASYTAGRETTAFFDTILHAALYVGMNMLLTSALLIKTGITANASQKKISATIGTIIIIALLALILITLLLNYSLVSDSEMPMVVLAVQISPVFSALSALILCFAIFLTLLSALYPLENYLSAYISNADITAIIIGAAAFLVSRVGFSYIITYIYPLQGLIGIAFIAFCAVFNGELKNKRKAQNSSPTF